MVCMPNKKRMIYMSLALSRKKIGVSYLKSHSSNNSSFPKFIFCTSIIGFWVVCQFGLFEVLLVNFTPSAVCSQYFLSNIHEHGTAPYNDYFEYTLHNPTPKNSDPER